MIPLSLILAVYEAVSHDAISQSTSLSLRFVSSKPGVSMLSVDIQKRILDVFEASQASKQQDRRDEKEAELLESLASDYKSDKDSVSARVPGTCERFFEDNRFLKWRDSKHSRLLWISAGPGCGKSVLWPRPSHQSQLLLEGTEIE